jgi:hypothetical protein
LFSGLKGGKIGERILRYLLKEERMQKTKRLVIATLSGVLFGFVCLGLAASAPGPLAWPVAVQIVTSRTLIGFAIGISAFSFGPWAVNGLVMGLIFSFPLAFSGLMAPENPEYSQASMVVFTLLLGMLYGLLTELITSGLFKARIPKLDQPSASS